MQLATRAVVTGNSSPLILKPPITRVSICAAGLAVFEDGVLTESLYWLVKLPKGYGWFRDDFIEVHGLTHLDVLNAPEFPAIAPEFLAG